MPDGADTVMMQEDCVVEDGRVRLSPGIRKGANRRHAGEDVAEGRGRACLPGGGCKPADLGLAAALGHDRLPVFRPLRVALLSTGDEVREPGTPLRAGRDLRRQPRHAGGAAARASAAPSAISASARTAPPRWPIRSPRQPPGTI